MDSSSGSSLCSHTHMQQAAHPSHQLPSQLQGWVTLLLQGQSGASQVPSQRLPCPCKQCRMRQPLLQGRSGGCVRHCTTARPTLQLRVPLCNQNPVLMLPSSRASPCSSRGAPCCQGSAGSPQWSHLSKRVTRERDSEHPTVALPVIDPVPACPPCNTCNKAGTKAEGKKSERPCSNHV